tara:strand:+ start:917 stop:1225 length:309 start_codon:yes stop_codon:yes gene_type:complete
MKRNPKDLFKKFEEEIHKIIDDDIISENLSITEKQKNERVHSVVRTIIYSILLDRDNEKTVMRDLLKLKFNHTGISKLINNFLHNPNAENDKIIVKYIHENF